MGNRSKYVATIGSAAAGMMAARALKRRRRARLGRAAEGFADTVMPNRDPVPEAVHDMDGDEAHAPGHRHLPLADIADQREPVPVYERPFEKHHRGLRHPGKI